MDEYIRELQREILRRMAARVDRDHTMLFAAARAEPRSINVDREVVAVRFGPADRAFLKAIGVSA